MIREVSHGLSNPEIARRLHLTCNTVKSHTRSPYRKLGVCDRTSAVLEGMRRGRVARGTAGLAV